jgi:hypothetical protein
VRRGLLLLVLLLAGCASAKPSQQAEDLRSLAAEGALMAHDVGEGGAWGPYTRAHANELAEKASSLKSKAKTAQLSTTAGLVERDLVRLQHADRGQAPLIEKRLTRLAKLLDQLA